MTGSAVLYVNNNGMTCCLDHGGSYLMSAHRNAPGRKTYVTPLDCWKRIDDDYAQEWAAIMAVPLKCEMCD